MIKDSAHIRPLVIEGNEYYLSPVPIMRCRSRWWRNSLPDIVISDDKRGWLILVEVVTSHGPVSPKRVVELEEFTKDCPFGIVYVTAFPNAKEFKKHVDEIAWETEVWLSDTPDHMIHFNGDRFIGPRR